MVSARVPAVLLREQEVLSPYTCVEPAFVDSKALGALARQKMLPEYVHTCTTYVVCRLQDA